MHWYILTGEYPPTSGGVSDYTCQVAEGLAARGELVTVYAPAKPEREIANEKGLGVRVEWLPGRFGWSGLRRLQGFLNAEPAGGRFLVQYVPHAFGWKAMNVPLCLWLAAQRRHALWVMFHEVSYPLEPGQPWRHNLLARVNQWMARRLATCAERVMVSTTAWIPVLEGICERLVKVDWAPIPSNFETSRPEETGIASCSLDHGRVPVIGHFGTFSNWIVQRLTSIIPSILALCPEVEIVLLGRGSERFVDQLSKAHSDLRMRLRGMGELTRTAVPEALKGCDMLIQPYSDGINTRRTSTMGGLALGLPIITHAGHNTEPIWRESGGVLLVDADAPNAWASAVRGLLDSQAERDALGARGATLYWSQFSLGKTLDMLLGDAINDR